MHHIHFLRIDEFLTVSRVHISKYKACMIKGEWFAGRTVCSRGDILLSELREVIHYSFFFGDQPAEGR